MLRPERWMEKEDEEIIYSDDEERQSDWKSEEDEDEWEINWDNMECVDEYGDDGEDMNKYATKKLEASSDEEFDDLELDAVDELNEATAVTNISNEKKKGDELDNEKNESDEEKEKEKEGDPWSRWVGMDTIQEKKMIHDGMEEKETKKEEKTERGTKKREKNMPTMAELVLKGKISGEDARKDKRNRVIERNINRRMESSIRRRDESSSRWNDSPHKRMRSPSLLLKKQKNRSPPMRDIRRISPSNPSYDSKRDRSSRRNPSPSIERGRHQSTIRKERRYSSPSNKREKRFPDRKEENRRMDVSIERRRKEGGREDDSLIPSTYRETMRKEKRDRTSFPSKRDIIPRLCSSPNRIRRSSQSPMKRDIQVSSSNRMIVERDRCPKKEEKRCRSPLLLPSLLNVKTFSPPRMEGRVKREEKIEERKEEEIPKDKYDRDGRDEKNEMDKKEKESNERKEEDRKRHIPIIWNDKETHAKKIHRSVGHMDIIETIERKKNDDERIEWKKSEDKIRSPTIPLSMIGRVGNISHHVTDKQRTTIIPPKNEIEWRESLASSSRVIPSMQKEHIKNRSMESTHIRLQPTELVRTITNNDVTIKMPEKQPVKKLNTIYEETSRMENKDSEDGCDWLSPNLMRLQGLGNDISLDIVDRKSVNPSAALRLFDRATASALTSSTMKDTRRVITKDVRKRIDPPDVFGETNREKKNIVTNERRIADRIEIRPPQDKGVIWKQRPTPKFEGKAKDHPRLLEIYY